MKKTKPTICFLLFAAFFATPSFSQNQISYTGSPTYSLVERTDLLRYDNNKYVGLVSREVRSFITPVSQKGGYLYEGNFFVHQDTNRNAAAVTAGIHDSILSVFRISSDGVLTMVEDHGYPSFRSFPSYPKNKVAVGERWQAKAERAVDPLNKGIVTKMPLYVEYTYLGDDYLNDVPVYKISAQWATRYGMGSGTSYIDWGGDRELQKATGTHKASILVSKTSGAALVVRDTVDETFVYADGNQIRLKGTINLFTEYPPAVDRDRLLPALRRFAMIDDEEEQALSRQHDENKTLVALVGESDSDFAGGKGGKNPKDDGGWEAFDEPLPDFGKSDKTGSSFNDEKLAKLDDKRTASEPFDAESDLKERDRRIKSNVIAKASEVSGSDGSSGEKKNASAITVDQTAAGIRLTIQDLQFAPDSAKLLPGEEKRLDNIAAVLKEAGLSQFLIEGHTARVGREDGEMQLSLDRAHAIAEALTKRGIQGGRFICKGSGGKKPVADNGTEAGRARNRRVEITILE